MIDILKKVEFSKRKLFGKRNKVFLSIAKVNESTFVGQLFEHSPSESEYENPFSPTTLITDWTKGDTFNFQHFGKLQFDTEIELNKRYLFKITNKGAQEYIGPFDMPLPRGFAIPRTTVGCDCSNLVCSYQTSSGVDSTFYPPTCQRISMDLDWAEVPADECQVFFYLKKNGPCDFEGYLHASDPVDPNGRPEDGAFASSIPSDPCHSGEDLVTFNFGSLGNVYFAYPNLLLNQTYLFDILCQGDIGALMSEESDSTSGDASDIFDIESSSSEIVLPEDIPDNAIVQDFQLDPFIENVETLLHTNNIKVAHDASDKRSTLNRIDSKSLNFGSISPGEASDILTISLRVPNTRIKNIKLGVIDAGELNFSNELIGYKISPKKNVIIQDYFEGENNAGNQLPEFNIDVPNISEQESEKVHIQLNISEQELFKAGGIRFKWFFDYLGLVEAETNDPIVTPELEGEDATLSFDEFLLLFGPETPECVEIKDNPSWRSTSYAKHTVGKYYAFSTLEDGSFLYQKAEENIAGGIDQIKRIDGTWILTSAISTSEIREWFNPVNEITGIYEEAFLTTGPTAGRPSVLSCPEDTITPDPPWEVSSSSLSSFSSLGLSSSSESVRNTSSSSSSTSSESVGNTSSSSSSSSSNGTSSSSSGADTTSLSTDDEYPNFLKEDDIESQSFGIEGPKTGFPWPAFAFSAKGHGKTEGERALFDPPVFISNIDAGVCPDIFYMIPTSGQCQGDEKFGMSRVSKEVFDNVANNNLPIPPTLVGDLDRFGDSKGFYITVYRSGPTTVNIIYDTARRHLVCRAVPLPPSSPGNPLPCEDGCLWRECKEEHRGVFIGASFALYIANGRITGATSSLNFEPPKNIDRPDGMPFDDNTNVFSAAVPSELANGDILEFSINWEPTSPEWNVTSPPDCRPPKDPDDVPPPPPPPPPT